jgi:hypothetical protein
VALGDAIEGMTCVIPQCSSRARDARAFCYPHWMALPNKQRRKISKLYTTGRRGHWSNPRRSAWRKVIEESIKMLAPVQESLPEIKVEAVVRESDLMDQGAVDALEGLALDEIKVKQMPDKPRQRRKFSKAPDDLREYVVKRLQNLGRSELYAIGDTAGLSRSTISSVGRNDLPYGLSMSMALAIKAVLDGSKIQPKPEARTAYLEYAHERWLDGEGIPTPEQAFIAGFEAALGGGE